MTTATQQAHLITDDGLTLVATVDVPAFPNSPKLIECNGRYFKGPNIGYGVTYLSYVETGAPFVVSKGHPGEDAVGVSHADESHPVPTLEPPRA